MARNGIDPCTPSAYRKLQQQLADPPVPPYSLNDAQMEVWRMIVETRAPKEWSGVDTFFAADLCVATIALRDARQQLADDDSVIVGPQGGRQINPLMPIIGALVNQTLRLSARLRLGVLDAGAETAVTTAAARRRKQNAQQMAEADDGIIYRPDFPARN